MIKFFRKVRQKLLSENKFSKYLLYAIGEIILVVIGILIAIQINNWNDDRKSRLKINQILKNVREELALNINNSDDITEFYRAKEENIGKVLHKKVSIEDYKSPKLVYLIWNSNTLDLLDDAVQELDSFTDFLNEEQDSLISRINQLYSIKPTIDIMDTEIEKAVNDFDSRLKTTTNWYYLSNDHQDLPEVAYDYFMKDTLYLNEVAFYESSGLENHFKYNAIFNNAAKNLYIDLSNYLNLKIDAKLIKPINQFQDYYGTYVLSNHINKDTLIIKKLNDRIVYDRINKNGRETYSLFPESEDEFVVGSRFARLIRDKNSQPNGFELTLGSSPKMEYRKIKR